MVPGAFGFDSLLGLDYWYGISDALREAGANVYVVNLSGLALIETRGEELRIDIENILALTGADKVNLIGHSQGAPTARHLASTSDMVASVTSVHGLNEGTPLTEDLSDLTNGIFGDLFVEINNQIFTNLESIATAPSDGEFNSPERGEQSTETLAFSASYEGLDEFNQNFPAGMPSVDCQLINNGYNGNTGGGGPIENGVFYYS